MHGYDGEATIQPTTTIHALFEHHVELNPEKPAVVARGNTLTYRELDRRANRIAWRLREAGVGPDALVGICVDRSVDMVVGLLAIMKAGGAYVPLDPDYPGERLRFMVKDSAVRVMITQYHLVPALPAGDVTVVPIDDPTDFDGYPAHRPDVVCGADNLAYVTYTSGSTGTPKGVLVRHGGVVNLVTAQNYVTITPMDRVASLATLSFDASTFEIWAPLLNGATCVVYTFGEGDVSYLCDRVRQDAVSVLHLTSPVFRLLEPAHFTALSAVHTLLFGGDTVRADLAARARASFHGDLIHLYGPTETTGFATFHAVRSAAEHASVIPIGVPIRNVRVRVLNPDGSEVPDGEEGELYIGGHGVARGYLNRAELTSERFVPDRAGGTGSPLYRSGDLVRRDADGVLHFLGRIDRQLKVRGYRVEPGETETVLARHPLVSDAVVVAREDASGDKQLHAYVVPVRRLTDGGDDAALVGELRDHITQVLPRHQHPGSLTVIADLPLTANLKLDLDRLPEPSRERRTDQEPPVAPGTDAETALTALWSELLGRDDVGIDDSFFDLGGDSITAVRMTASARKNLGIEVKFRDFLRSPTIRRMAAPNPSAPVRPVHDQPAVRSRR